MTRLSAGLLLAALCTAPVHAQDARDDEIAELRAQLAALTARLDQLEQRDATVAVAEPLPEPAAGAVAEWPNRVRLSGDLRYRHETINDDASTERNRHRIRARVGLTADVNEDVTVGMVLSSGGDNPISGNQSLGSGFSRKSFGIDRAFFEWDASDAVAIRGGKMGNPMFRAGSHPLIFDGDLNPEGLALRYGSGNFFANFGGFFTDERRSGDDGILLASQVGFDGTIGDSTDLTLGASYYDYQNTRGYPAFFDGTSRGNTLDANGNYLFDYKLVELFAQLNFDLGGQPLRVFADYVQNQEVDLYDTGYAVGLRWRSASAPGSWDIGWAYEDLEADAVVATFTDSDFAGGGTDGRGHVFRTNYVFRERWNLGLTYFLNERGEAAGNLRDYKRLQADISFRY